MVKAVEVVQGGGVAGFEAEEEAVGGQYVVAKLYTQSVANALLIKGYSPGLQLSLVKCPLTASQSSTGSL